MSEKFIIVDENKGAFVGTYCPGDVGEEFDALIKAYMDKGKITKDLGLLFADDNIFDIDRCAAFPTREAATGFVHWMLDTFSSSDDARKLRLTILPVNCEGERFATSLELLRSGHQKHIKQMADNYWKLYAEANKEGTIH